MTDEQKQKVVGVIQEGKTHRRFRRVLILGLAAIVAGGVWLVMHYVGETRNQRLRQHIVMLTNDEPPRASINALRAAGPDASFRALMTLVRDMLDKPPREWTVSPNDALRALVKIHGERSGEGAEVFLSALGDDRPEIRSWALHAISRSCSNRRMAGSVPNAILPAVVEALGDTHPWVREEACDCFVDVHPDWQVGLINCLQHSNPLVRCTAIDALGGRGGQDDRVGRFPDAVLPMLDDPDSRVRATAAMSLARLGRGNDRVLALLRDAIQGDDPELRTSACAAVGDIGSAAAAAVPDLMACLTDEDKVTRRCAAASLADIAPAKAAESEAACAILLEALEDGGMPAVFAAQSLGKLGVDAPSSAISALQRATTSDHAFVRNEAKNALEKIRGMKR